MNRRYFFTAPGHAALWAGLGLLAAALLGAYAFVDFAFFGSNPTDHPPHPYTTADSVSYGPYVWRTFYYDDVLSGHSTYPLLWGWALVATLGLWPLRGRDAAARAMWLVYALTLAFLLLAGEFWLPYAAGDHNAVLGMSGDLPRHLAAAWYLEAEACSRWSEGSGGCQAWHESRVLNPVPLGLLGLTLAPLLGLWAGGRITPPASA